MLWVRLSRVADILAARPDAIVLSPGPCTPREAGICLELIEAASAEIMPAKAAGATDHGRWLICSPCQRLGRNAALR
jgi:hypothetical protein